MKCEAKTQEGKRCSLNASAQVGGASFCGNHAAQVRSTQLMHSAEPKGPFAVKALSTDEVKAAEMLKTLRALQQVNAPERVLVAMLVAWKKGDLA